MARHNAQVQVHASHWLTKSNAILHSVSASIVYRTHYLRKRVSTNVVCKASMPKTAVVVGAGFAGLSAAKRLSESTDWEVIVLEGSNRIGGRAHSANVGVRSAVEFGATWIHGVGTIGNENPMYKLAVEYGLLPSCLVKGAQWRMPDVLLPDGRTLTPGLEDALQASYMQFSEAIEEVHEHTTGSAAGILTNYWQQLLDSPCARVWTDEQRNVAAAVWRWQELKQRAIDGCSSTVDMGCISLNQYTDWHGAHVTIPYGFQTLAERLAEGMTIRFGHRVKQIRYGSNGCKIECHNGATLAADAVLVTVSLGVLKAEQMSLFDPALPAWKAQAIADMGMGVVDKMLIQVEGLRPSQPEAESQQQDQGNMANAHAESPPEPQQGSASQEHQSLVLTSVTAAEQSTANIGKQQQGLMNVAALADKEDSKFLSDGNVSAAGNENAARGSVAARVRSDRRMYSTLASQTVNGTGRKNSSKLPIDAGTGVTHAVTCTPGTSSTDAVDGCLHLPDACGGNEHQAELPKQLPASSLPSYAFLRQVDPEAGPPFATSGETGTLSPWQGPLTSPAGTPSFTSSVAWSDGVSSLHFGGHGFLQFRRPALSATPQGAEPETDAGTSLSNGHHPTSLSSTRTRSRADKSAEEQHACSTTAAGCAEGPCIDPCGPHEQLAMLWLSGEHAMAMEVADDIDVQRELEQLLNKYLGTADAPAADAQSQPSNQVQVRSVVTSRWGTDPLFRGSYSYMTTRCTPDTITKLAEPICVTKLQGGDRTVDTSPNSAAGKVPCEGAETQTGELPVLLFAGEATHFQHFGTTHGAFFSGLREANRLLKAYGS